MMIIYLINIIIIYTSVVHGTSYTHIGADMDICLKVSMDVVPKCPCNNLSCGHVRSFPKMVTDIWTMSMDKCPCPLQFDWTNQVPHDFFLQEKISHSNSSYNNNKNFFDNAAFTIFINTIYY